MARVPYLDRKDVKPEHQDLLARNINLYRALVHSPDGLRSFSALGHFIRHTSRLDPRLRELAILQVSAISRARPMNIPTTSRSAATSASATKTSARSPTRPPAGPPSSSPLPRRRCAPPAR